MATKFLHTVPTGTVRGPFGLAGTVTGIATYSQDLNPDDLDNGIFVTENVALVKAPIETDLKIGSILASSFAAGRNNTPFDTLADVLSGLTESPAEGLFYNGVEWVKEYGGSAGRVQTLSIEDAGSGYSVSTGVTTFISSTTPEDLIPTRDEATGLTVDIDSVGANGEITSVSVNDPGYLYLTGQEIVVKAGVNRAILKVTGRVKPVIATFNCARTTSNPNRLAPSFFESDLPGVTGQNVYLYQPTTKASLYYDDTLSGDFRYTSGTSDVFNGSDFTLEIRGVGPLNFHYATVTIPLNDTNQVVSLQAEF